MEGGRIQQAGHPLAVYREPDNLFVAGFIGTPPMNLLRGALVSLAPGAGLSFRHAGGMIPLAEELSSALGPFSGRPAVLGIRPESLGVTAADEGPGRVRGTVDVVEPMGAETFLQVVAEDGGRLTARVAPECKHRPGEVVFLPVPTERALFFDGETGVRLGARV